MHLSPLLIIDQSQQIRLTEKQTGILHLLSWVIASRTTPPFLLLSL